MLLCVFVNGDKVIYVQKNILEAFIDRLESPLAYNQRNSLHCFI